MHQDIIVLVEADNSEFAIRNAYSEIDDNIIRIGSFFNKKPIEIIQGNNSRFWEILKEFSLLQYQEIKYLFKNAKSAELYSSKIFYKAQAYRGMCGWQFPGSYIINGVNQSSLISFKDRKCIKDDPESYYIVIYNYHN